MGEQHSSEGRGSGCPEGNDQQLRSHCVQAPARRPPFALAQGAMTSLARLVVAPAPLVTEAALKVGRLNALRPLQMINQGLRRCLMLHAAEHGICLACAAQLNYAIEASHFARCGRMRCTNQ